VTLLLDYILNLFARNIYIYIHKFAEAKWYISNIELL